MRKSKDIRPHLIFSLSALILGCGSDNYTRYCVDEKGNRVSDTDCERGGYHFTTLNGNRVCENADGQVVADSYCVPNRTGSVMGAAYGMRRWAYSRNRNIIMGSPVPSRTYTMPDSHVSSSSGTVVHTPSSVSRGGFGNSSHSSSSGSHSSGGFGG